MVQWVFQQLHPIDGERYWYGLIGVETVKGATMKAYKFQVSGLIFLFLPKPVHPATQQENPVPTLWHQLSLMVKILNYVIVLASLLQYVVERVKKCYYMIKSGYGVYDCFVKPEWYRLG